MDFFQEASRLCAQRCETALKQNGIRSIVTYRAKRMDTLKMKLENRNAEKQYKTADDCKNDIPDLAGVRIALYFPGDLQEVRRLLESQFAVEKAMAFPQRVSHSLHTKSASVAMLPVTTGFAFLQSR